MIKITRADLKNDSHAEALVELMRIYAMDPMGGGRDLSDYVRANLAAALSDREDIHVVLAYEDGEAAGLITCIEGFSTFACKPLLKIHDVVVRPEFRGRGISRMLFNEAEAIAKERGCCKLTLEVLEGNKVAISAYARLGFSAYQLDPALGKALFWEKKL